MSTKLYYFNARGLCEPIRLILAYGGEEFEDIRAPLPEYTKTGPITRAELPPEILEKCTWGQVPFIEFEGKKLAQSNAIARYYANKFKLVPTDDFEAALCDEYVDTCREFYLSLYPLVQERDEEKQKVLRDEFKKTVGEKYLKRFNSIIEANGGQRLVGNSLTWADIILAHCINQAESLECFVPGLDIVKDYPALQSLAKTVFAVPQIKNWVEKRPKTMF